MMDTGQRENNALFS